MTEKLKTFAELEKLFTEQLLSEEFIGPKYYCDSETRSLQRVFKEAITQQTVPDMIETFNVKLSDLYKINHPDASPYNGEELTHNTYWNNMRHAWAMATFGKTVVTGCKDGVFAANAEMMNPVCRTAKASNPLAWKYPD